MAQDPQDPGTADLFPPEIQPKRPRGRPRLHPDAKTASRAASMAYRERRKARREAPEVASAIIDLSALPAWKVGKGK